MPHQTPSSPSPFQAGDAALLLTLGQQMMLSALRAEMGALQAILPGIVTPSQAPQADMPVSLPHATASSAPPASDALWDNMPV
ncbi:MAG: hypothetical protein MUD11_07170 [Rhodobacteraceae bacterium]|nr:hypothetical protein [Paracoccaceae bacterium]